MGQVPPKYMLPAAPYGSSQAANAINKVQPAAVNPQQPLLPPNFTDPGTMSNPVKTANSRLFGGGRGLFGGFGGGDFSSIERIMNE